MYQKLIHGKTTAPKSLKIPKEMKVQYFKFSPKVLNAHVTRAYLWVHVKNPNGMNDQSPDGRSGRLESGQNGKTKTAWVVVYQAVRSNPNDAPTLLHVSLLLSFLSVFCYLSFAVFCYLSFLPVISRRIFVREERKIGEREKREREEKSQRIINFKSTNF